MREEQHERRVRPAESEHHELDRKRRMALSLLFQGQISKAVSRINSYGVASEDYIKFLEKQRWAPQEVSCSENSGHPQRFSQPQIPKSPNNHSVHSGIV